MEFGIVGPIEARRADGSPFPIGGPQVRALLAALALDAGRVVGRKRLIDELYGEQPPGDAGHALQSQVSRLRRALRNGVGEGELVQSGGAGYRLAVDPEAVDALRFGRLAARGRKAVQDKDFGAAMTLLEEALGLWRGPALADVRDAPFAQGRAARLTEARLAAEEDRAEAALAVGEPLAVVGYLSELVAAQPLRERARALLMRGLYAAGRQAEALESFEQGRRLLADELGADPSAELMDAHLAILRADVGAAVSNRRLPTPLTSFVGRDAELARLAPLVARARLVTLTGPGGTGKTRLALAAGSRVRGEVCFVEMAPLVDGVQAAQAIANALGGRDLSARAAGGPRDTESRLVVMLVDRPLLLILDNCEHVVLDVARLAHRLLVACPGLRILATSREALRVTGEMLFPVPQLPTAPTDSALADQLAAPAVRLFAERAAAVSLRTRAPSAWSPASAPASTRPGPARAPGPPRRRPRQPPIRPALVRRRRPRSRCPPDRRASLVLVAHRPLRRRPGRRQSPATRTEFGPGGSHVPRRAAGRSRRRAVRGVCGGGRAGT
ncbi:AfsR/SARP family transcriptional regulator [Nocardia aurantiaca]|uniref:OmpR/PhoB-type domain-containing protein n=1 Tax=Nocardia aurantiaca TaxID=2675850 RepID=A0A6I3KY79_9NOCA|nr:BTAD domain-containing putative transcriptional regulator [Nocardia aurantiaca]MTE13335.1 hypothetical protein [Nocardia aurantiaca]